MVFNFKLLLRLVCKSLFATRGTNARLTAKRSVLLFLGLSAYTFSEIANWIGFLLDEIFFRSYRKLEIREPVFILGVPRSGTTYLHRLLAKDDKQFTSMTFFEIMFAPSITQKKIWMTIWAMDRRLGSPIFNQILTLEKRIFMSMDQIHKTSLFEPEEDENILFHIFSSATLGYIFPFDDEIRPFMFFDEEILPLDRARIMKFYQQCVQRHLFVVGKDKRYLSKNPSFSSKVQSIGETFPDAKVICMLRTPFEVLPSVLNTISNWYKFFTSPIEPCPMRETILLMIAHWYRYPVYQLKKWANERQVVLKYENLMQNPEHTILSIYERFGFDISTHFRQILREATEKAKQYKSSHNYSLEQTGLTHEQIISDYKDILEQFNFDNIEDPQQAEQQSL
jgi:hypothetical protein